MAVTSFETLDTPLGQSVGVTSVCRVTEQEERRQTDYVAVEEPLEIRLGTTAHFSAHGRACR